MLTSVKKGRGCLVGERTGEDMYLGERTGDCILGERKGLGTVYLGERTGDCIFGGKDWGLYTWGKELGTVYSRRDSILHQQRS